MTRSHTLLAAGVGAVVAALVFAPHAHGAVTVYGSGLARACSLAAKQGKTDSATEKLCTDALDTEAMAPEARAGTLVNRGIIKMRRKNFDGAIADFDRAEKFSANVGEIYVNRGGAFVGKGRYAESIAQIDKGLALGIEEPEKAYYNRALAHEGLDDMKAAYFDYMKAQSLKPDWAAPKEQLVRFRVEQRSPTAPA